MKLSIKALAIAGVVGIFALTGCAGLDQAMKNIQQATISLPTPPTPTPALNEESLPQICQAAKDNPVRAKDLYTNKRISITGEVGHISELFQPRYRVLLKAGGVRVHTGTDSTASIKRLTIGEMATTIGTISDVSYDYMGCSVSLKNAMF